MNGLNVPAQSSISLLRPTTADARAISRLIADTWSRFFAYSVTDSDLSEYLAGPLSSETIAKDISNLDMRFLIAVIPPNPPAPIPEQPSLLGATNLLPSGSTSLSPVPSPMQRSRSGSHSRSRSGSISGEPQPTEGEIIGVAQLVLHTSEPCLTLPKPIELRRLYVSEKHHRAGVAQRLMQGVDELARSEGYGSVWLGVWEDNHRGKRFYEKVGYRTVGEHTFMVGESRRRDWVMEKEV